MEPAIEKAENNLNIKLVMKKLCNFIGKGKVTS